MAGEVALEDAHGVAGALAGDVGGRIADRITQFAGSMTFVYIHIVWFGSWIALGVEKYPYGLLTMIVSLEAIFLSTCVMISQNRADTKRQVVADLQWPDRPGGGQAKPAAARSLEPDPGADQSGSRLRGCGWRDEAFDELKLTPVEGLRYIRLQANSGGVMSYYAAQD